jgi:hypothetical protein
MSRTSKGSKGCGYDYWGKRPLSGNCGYGKIVKTISKRIERARAKRDIRNHKDMPNREPF